MSKAVWIIRDEHQRYGAVLNLVRNLITKTDAGAATIDIDLLDLAFDYIDCEARQAMKDNDPLLPIAETVLTSADWSEIEAAFADNDDRAFGGRPKAKFTAMMAQIVRRAPAPYGYRT